MTLRSLTFIAGLLSAAGIATADALAAGPVLVQPNPVVLPSEPAPTPAATALPPEMHTRDLGPSAKAGTKVAKAKSHATKKPVKPKAPAKATGKPKKRR